MEGKGDKRVYCSQTFVTVKQSYVRTYIPTGSDPLQTHYRLHMWHKACSLECNQTCQPCVCVCVSMCAHACVMHRCACVCVYLCVHV